MTERVRSAAAGLQRGYGLLVVASLVLALLVAASWRSAAVAADSGGQLVAEPVLKSAAAGVVRLYGASPQESPGEVWGSGAGKGIARYTDAGGWERVPPPVDADGQEVPGVSLVTGALAGRTTSSGGLVAAALAGGTKGAKSLVVRDPGGSLRLVAEPEPVLLLNEKRRIEYESKATEAEKATFFSAQREELFPTSGNGVMLTAVEEPGSRSGAFVVPVPKNNNAQDGVLRFDGSQWTRERICLDPACAQLPTQPSFRVLAIDASGPGNAWLLAKGAVAGDGIELFRREAGGIWLQQPLGGQQGSRYGKANPFAGVTVSARAAGQILTVTPAGLWVDANVRVGSENADATFYFSGGQVQGSWCDAQGAGAALCDAPLGSELPSGQGRSFAWAGGGSGGFGTRAITGVGQGAMLVLTGTEFERVGLAGGRAGGENGAALSAPDQGWLGGEVGPLRLTRQPSPAALQSWPVPFRRPLTAIAPEPGAPVAALSSEAIAVGDEGQVARYRPGQGWVAEPLLNNAGARARPRLRAAAWPRHEFAYAVGDEGAMWLWRGSSGLWEPDPGAPPNLIRGNFTGVAFDPSNPARGYAVGKQGLLLRYGRQWTQERLPAEVNPEVNFTSVAFAGSEALATFRFPLDSIGGYSGGLLVEDGSGWRVEADVGGTPVLVAGLPDGGAAAIVQSGTDAQEYLVVSRNAPGAPWVAAPEPVGGVPTAMAAFRESGQVRVAVSVAIPQEPVDRVWGTDSDQIFNQPPAGQAPLLTEPYPLASRGLLERQTATGWRDEQHASFPISKGSNPLDLPREPDPLLALMVAPDGSSGWVVGGETGERVDSPEDLAVQTATVMRYGADAAPPPNFSSSPIPGTGGVATFAIAGNAQCAAACADQQGTGIGPDIWLPAAVRTAATVPGVRAFIYTGPGVAAGREEAADPSKRLGATLTRAAFAREESAYARRLGSSAGSLPVFPTPASSDLDRSSSLGTFASAFSGITPIGAPELSRGYYAFASPGSAGTVRVIVLDYSDPTRRLDTARNGNQQRCWLAGELAGAAAAGTPAIVIGNRDLGARAPENLRAKDAAQVIPILVNGTAPDLPATCSGPAPAGASAYFFDYPEENRTYRLISGARSIPAFGSGTLGYVRSLPRNDFAGASGVMIVSVDVGARNPATNVAPVRKARLIPNIGELALEAADGTLLRRSQPALFRGLARRLRAGGKCAGQAPPLCESLQPDPYVAIPSRCQGPNCSSALFPEYEFTSSKPDVADFVEVDPATSNPRSVLLGANDKPTPDPTSGLLCAFNAGTTTVTVKAGGLAYSMPVTVQPGSVQRPCGTVPLREKPAPDLVTPPAPIQDQPQPRFESPPSLPPPPPAPASAPTPAQPQVAPLPVPPPVPPVFLPPPAAAITPVPVIVPPPPPPTAQTTPPSGTSPVTQPVTAPEPEEEEEAAFDLVHHMAAYRPAERAPAWLVASAPAAHERAPGPPLRLLIPALLVLAALAGATIARGPRRPRGAPLAYELSANDSRRNR